MMIDFEDREPTTPTWRSRAVTAVVAILMGITFAGTLWSWLTRLLGEHRFTS